MQLYSCLGFQTKNFSYYDDIPRACSILFGNRNELVFLFLFFFSFLSILLFVCSSSRIYFTNVVCYSVAVYFIGENVALVAIVMRRAMPMCSGKCCGTNTRTE